MSALLEGTALAASVRNNLGPKRILIMRMDFSDAPGAIVSQNDAVSRMQEVSAFLRANSFQQMWFEVIDVTPLLRLSATASYYATNNYSQRLLTDARYAATQAGYPEGDYDYDILTLPYVGFPWAALAFVGAKGILIQDPGFNHYVITHELGHSFGNQHANGWFVEDDNIIGPGANEEYANSFDPMGSSSLFPLGHYNANAKYLAGWLTEEHMHTVSTSGTYRIWAVDSGAALQPAHPYAARIPAGFSLGGVVHDYWLDYRQQLVSNAWLMNGVVLKAANDFAALSGTRMLDTSPASSHWFLDAPLLIGRTYSDLDRGVFITPVAKGTNDSLPFIDVRINVAVPASRAPTVVVQAGATAVDIGEAVQLTALASDPDGDSLAYGWDFGDNSVVPASLNQAEAVKSWNAHGEFVVRSIVSDMKGRLASDSVIVRVGNPRGRRISGRVLLGSQPLEGVRIQAYGPVYPSGYTDSDGTYTVTGLTPGGYNIAASKSGYTFTREFSEPILMESNDIVMINFQAVPKSRPFIVEFTPSTGSVGSAVSIFGTNFSGARGVLFDHVPASFTIASAREISAIVPDGAISGAIVVSGLTGSDTSLDAFTVTPSFPAIITQPQSQRLWMGSNATFSVKTSGSGPLAHQWIHDDAEIPGATNSSYVISGVQSNHAGIYTVRVTNPLGTETSAPATLIVVPPIPFTEALETPDLIWSTSGTVPWLTQTNVTHDGTDAAQACCLVLDQQHSRLQTTVIGPGRVSFWWRISSGFPDTHYLFFHVGQAEKGFIRAVQNWTSASFFVPAGPQVLAWTYRKQSSSTFVGQNKAWLDEVTFVHIDGEPPVITQQPQNQTVEVGESAMFTVTATGSEPLFYQWRNWTGDIPGATNSSLLITNVVFDNAFMVNVSNNLDNVWSQWSGLTVRPRMRPEVILRSVQGDFVEEPEILLEATASDLDGTVTLVEFFHETNLLGQASAAPYVLSWSNMPRGTYTFTARASDNQGNLATSAPVTVNMTAFLPRGSLWKYFDQAGPPENSWRGLDFDDSSWAGGAAELGYGNSPITTLGFGPDPTNKHLTAWFRKIFVVNAPLPSSNLTLRVKRDDGAIVYVNGNEVFRNNLAEGPVDHLTRALQPIEGPEEEQLVTVGLDPSLILEGTNVVAVEIHQSNPNSPDLSFDLSLLADLPWAPPRIRLVSPAGDESFFGRKVLLRAGVEDFDGHVSRVEFFHEESKVGETTTPPFSFLWTNAPTGYNYASALATDNTGQTAGSGEVGFEVIDASVPFGGPWRYLDEGSDLQANWRSLDFDDSAWPLGEAEFGYGYENPVTTIGFGSDPENKHITSYFRHAFEVIEPSAISSATIRLRRDDGAVVYLNGSELFRENLPTGEMTARTLALKSIEGAAEDAYVQRGIAPALLRPGRNVLAVEVHQDSPSSPDLRFDLALGVNMRSHWPWIEIIAPAPYVPADGPSVVFEADASDGDGHIALVEWFADEIRIGESTSGPPFTLAWSNVPPCSYAISANAIDNEGLLAAAYMPLEVVSPRRFKTLVPRWWSFWRYLDSGTDQGSAWRFPEFHDKNWEYSQSDFGFGDEEFGEYNTEIKPVVTTYFRHRFVVPEPATFTNLVVLFEPASGEGTVVYLNGVELYRAGLPPGEISASTHAGEFGATYNTNAIAALREGANVLAVEFHQPNPMPYWSAFWLKLVGGRTGELPVLAPCFRIRNWDASAFITWGDSDNWSLESADDVSGPWSFHADGGAANYPFYLASQKFFRLQRR